jgi:SWI/SNF-related matrix-associated actin-dependent regulator of chromatin subfamily A3
MVQREKGPIPPEFCLWKPSEGENEGWYGHAIPYSQRNLLSILRYLHAVTKARTRILHSETGGGILADEMGMGKSLSTLALITKTLEDAHHWISPDYMDTSDENQPRAKRSRATLVIVPSASKLLTPEWIVSTGLTNYSTDQ